MHEVHRPTFVDALRQCSHRTDGGSTAAATTTLQLQPLLEVKTAYLLEVDAESVAPEQDVEARTP
jgi:hypothetical protein